jgi:hypothetical protein
LFFYFIYTICRKKITQETVYFSEIKDEIIFRVQEKLEQFWNEGISGTDLKSPCRKKAIESAG